MTSASATAQGFPFPDLDGSLTLDHDTDFDPEPRNSSSSLNHQRSSIDSNLLSPFLSGVDSDAISPSNHFETTPAESTTLSHYQSSDFSDLDEDPFFGVNFANPDAGTPSFLDDQSIWEDLSVNHDNNNSSSDNNDNSHHHTTSAELQDNVINDPSYPLTPEQTASIHTVSPRSEQRSTLTRPDQGRLPNSVSPQQLQKPFKPNPIVVPAPQPTPSQSGSGRSSEDGLAPAQVDMPCQSPRVTISVWGGDNNGPVHTIERTFEDSPSTVRGGIGAAGDLISSSRTEQAQAHASRDAMGQWRRDPVTGHAGLDPKRRPGEEIASINEIISRRDLEERNEKVGTWLSNNVDEPSVPRERTQEEIRVIEETARNSNDNIPLGDNTENKYIPGQTYYSPDIAGQMSDEDYDIIYANRNWADAPMLHSIRSEESGRHQPQSSNAAIERFERMCRDNDSIISRAATWGTRRRSLPSVIDFDMEGVTSGNFLKKLSISRGGERMSRPGSILKDLRGLVRRPSASGRKRSRSGQGDALFQQDEPQPPQGKRESLPHLSPTSRTSSWSKKQTPSINTALVSMGQNFASIGTTHSRNGSISGAAPTPSKSPFSGLSVKNSLRRPRSKSELPKSSPNVDTQSNLVQMWRKSGGPPVAPISKAQVDLDDDDEEDDEFYEDNDMKMNPNIIDEIAPNFAGFQEHIQTLNPGLTQAQAYLVDRIAHQQSIRYKQLLNAKVKHLGLGAHCPCGSLCLALGGSANLLDSKGDAKELDPLSKGYDDDDVTPTEGAINQESFPTDIPMPPTQHLPAEFECQLCYTKRKFHKPSDWTKHVHEDVQPFTCTWDKCRDPKIFKRKADWVRHENEGHRHLEWWMCDVDDCRHTCYRRDNFLQHLVREHKFPEPKVKTKAAMKKAGNIDQTWAKVEECHVETSKQPQEEPCRFCGKMFPTWKKLTVHLAKHMEQISLPVLRLVAAKAKELAADTIISPVHDPPPRRDIPLPGDQTSPAIPYHGGDVQQHMHSTPQQMSFQQNQGQFIYPVMPPGQFQQAFYSAQQFDNIGQNMHQSHSLSATPAMGASPMHQAYDPGHHVADLPVTSAPFVHVSNQYMAMPTSEMEQFPPLNALGLQNVGAPAMGGPMGYDGIMDPSSSGASPFSGHESLSTYSHSPHLGATNAEKPWDDRHMSGYR